MNQGKLEVVKQEMARVNVDILGISKLIGLMLSFKTDLESSLRASSVAQW